MSIRIRIMALAMVPVLVFSIYSLVSSMINMGGLSDYLGEESYSDLYASKSEQIRSYTELAYTSIKSIYEGPDSHTPEARERAAERLRQLRYGKAGYAFVYDSDGVRHIYGSYTDGVGDSFYNLQDKNGRYIIRELIKATRQGNGFFTYHRPNPGNNNRVEPKLSYAIYLDKWDWHLGTGTYIDDVTSAVENTENAIEEVLDSNFVGSAVVTLLLLVASVVLVIFSSRILISAINQIQHTMEDLASGEADLTKRISIKGRDEVAQAARAFNTFMERLQAMMRDIGSVSRELNVEVGQMEANASEARQIVTEQTQDMGFTAASTRELQGATNNIAENAVQGAANADQANRQSEEAQQTLHRATGSVTGLVEKVNTASDTIESLVSDVENIFSVLSVIQGIAEQTNLLALNAAIEAARAGEQGRGFAVVADEVRGLAGRTQQSTEEINTMIGNLQTAAGEAVSVMSSCRDLGGTTAEQSQAAMQAIEQIIDPVNQITQMNHQIAAAAEEQTHVVNEINSKVSAVSDMSGRSNELAESNASACARITDLQGKLSEMVARLRI